MSPKLLQKTSNRFLQLSPPENLIPNKRLGKRERFRIRPGTTLNIQSRLCSELLREWVFSWNTLEKKMQQQERKKNSVSVYNSPEKSTKSIKLSVSVPGAVPSVLFPRSLLTPAAYMTNSKINRAVGGNLLEHLNQYVRGGSSGERNFFPTVSGNPEGGGKGESGESVINRGTFSFAQNRRPSAAEFVAQQIQSKSFHMIYSLQEKGKASNRRDRINDDYGNQLAECRKIGLIYGDLQKKTLVRTMRRAAALGGNVDSNFLSLLETRLDVTLKRAFFFPTVKAARQWIKRGNILVNNQPKTVSAYLLQPGDMITITAKGRQRWKEQPLRRLGPTLEQLRQPVNSMKKQRRFFFSPLLMQKWKEWSLLWGNSRYFFSTAHRWSGGVSQKSANYTGSASRGREFSSCFSAFAAYASNSNGDWRGKKGRKKAAFLENISPLLLRRETNITRWLVGGSNPLTSTASKRKSGINRADQKPFFTGVTGEKKIFSQWLHQQQSHVVDGLFAPRWNKAFIAVKTGLERKLTRRWSCIKPLHLECSYKSCTIIFLYSPQKLAWPCSINVFLLRKALGG